MRIAFAAVLALLAVFADLDSDCLFAALVFFGSRVDDDVDDLRARDNNEQNFVKSLSLFPDQSFHILD